MKNKKQVRLSCYAQWVHDVFVFLFQSSVDTYEESMPSGNTTHTNQHQANLPKGTVIV